MNLKYWGLAIPGLAMRGNELPQVEGLIRTDHPDIIGPAHRLGFYELRDVAKFLAESLTRQNIDEPFQVMGMSMGGMIASILATDFRKMLPKKTSFRLMVTSCNSPDLPSIPWLNLLKFVGLSTHSEKAIRTFMPYLFSPNFRKSHPMKVESYVKYLKNRESGYSQLHLARQIHGIRNFQGPEYYKNLDPSECLLIGGAEDRLLGPEYDRSILRINPTIPYRLIPRMGHMCHLESPELFERELSPGI